MNETVMVVGHYPTESELLAGVLARSGYKSMVFPLPKVNLAVIRGCRPQALILNVSFLHKSDHSLLRAVAQDTFLRQIRIIVLARGQNESEIIEALNSGADYYLHPDISEVQLVLRLGRLLTIPRFPKPQSWASDELRVGGFHLNSRSMRVRTPYGFEFRLTPIEFKILSFLLERVDTVCTYREIETRVWGDGYVAPSAYTQIRGYVCQLRQKCEQDPQSPLHILTEQGVGYRFEA